MFVFRVNDDGYFVCTLVDVEDIIARKFLDICLLTFGEAEEAYVGSRGYLNVVENGF
jgi:hypothetical protein